MGHVNSLRGDAVERGAEGSPLRDELLHGRAWLFGDDISTDHIAPGRLFHLRTNMPELAKHVLESIPERDPARAKEPGVVMNRVTVAEEEWIT